MTLILNDKSCTLIVCGELKIYYNVSIDNDSWIRYKSIERMFDLNPSPLIKEKHTISVAQGKEYDFIFI
ncbi:hypothetical protein GCM10027566_33570 [Arachidicoccus ginsenosidivorans]